MSLLAVFACLWIQAAPAPAPAVSPAPAPSLFELWSWADPSDAGDAWLAPTPPPALAPRGGWRPYMIVRADGHVAWIDSAGWDHAGTPYAETQLGPAELAHLRELVATLGLTARRFTCESGPRPGDPFGVLDLDIRTRVVVPGHAFEWPYCANETVPARLDHLVRVASSLARRAPAGPLYAIGVQPHDAPTPAAPALVIERDGRWRTAQRSGRLSTEQLAALAARIRDTRLTMNRQTFHCAAEPTHATTLDLGLAGALTWVAPCGDGPHADVKALMAYVATLVPADR